MGVIEELGALTDEGLVERIQDLRVNVAFALTRPEQVITLAGMGWYGAPRMTRREAGLVHAARSAGVLEIAERIARDRGLAVPDSTAMVNAALGRSDEGFKIASRFIRSR